jgi:hypothetical protein
MTYHIFMALIFSSYWLIFIVTVVVKYCEIMRWYEDLISFFILSCFCFAISFQIKKAINEIIKKIKEPK